MSDKPESAADPRPNGEPYYIDNECEDCGGELVLYDELTDEQLRSSDALADPDLTDRSVVWHDEWVCPDCLGGVYMDWPEEYAEEILNPGEGEEFEFTELEDV